MFGSNSTEKLIPCEHLNDKMHFYIHFSTNQTRYTICASSLAIKCEYWRCDSGWIYSVYRRSIHDSKQSCIHCEPMSKSFVMLEVQVNGEDLSPWNKAASVKAACISAACISAYKRKARQQCVCEEDTAHEAATSANITVRRIQDNDHNSRTPGLKPGRNLRVMFGPRFNLQVRQFEINRIMWLKTHECIKIESF